MQVLLGFSSSGSLQVFLEQHRVQAIGSEVLCCEPKKEQKS